MTAVYGVGQAAGNGGTNPFTAMELGDLINALVFAANNLQAGLNTGQPVDPDTTLTPARYAQGVAEYVSRGGNATDWMAPSEYAKQFAKAFGKKEASLWPILLIGGLGLWLLSKR